MAGLIPTPRLVADKAGGVSLPRTRVVLDSWTQAGANFTGGRFGVVIPSNYEVRLSGFGFYPKE